MEINFKTNDYLLAWYLLFKPSLTDDIQELKMKLWNDYSEEYKNIEKDNIEILKDLDNFIPDNDIIYDRIFKSKDFKNIKKETEEHLYFIRDIWDSHKEEVNEILNELLRFKIKDSFDLVILYKELNVSEYIKNNPSKVLAWGRSDDKRAPINTLIRIIYTLLKYELSDIDAKEDIKSSIIDLVVTNELQSRIRNKSTYDEGFKELSEKKELIYPYFLMYLGYLDKEKIEKKKKSDKVKFNLKYQSIEDKLQNVNLKEFIMFCSENEKYLGG